MGPHNGTIGGQTGVILPDSSPVCIGTLATRLFGESAGWVVSVKFRALGQLCRLKFARINVQAVPGGWPDQARNTPGLPTWLVRTPAGVLTRIIGRRAAPEQFLASLHSKLADFSSDVGGDPACVHKKEDGTFEKVPCVPLE